MESGGADSTDVHARPFSNGLQSFKYCDVFGAVVVSHDLLCAGAYSKAGGASISGGKISVILPRLMISRPLPPRLETSYLARLMRCSPPMLVFTVRVSVGEATALVPSTRSDGASLMRDTPFPGPDK